MARLRTSWNGSVISPIIHRAEPAERKHRGLLQGMNIHPFPQQHPYITRFSGWWLYTHVHEKSFRRNHRDDIISSISSEIRAVKNKHTARTSRGRQIEHRADAMRIANPNPTVSFLLFLSRVLCRKQILPHCAGFRLPFTRFLLAPYRKNRTKL